MKTGQNDLFRFMSVRGPEPVYSAEPTRDIPDVEVLKLLSAIDVDLRQPDPKIPGLLAGVRMWNRQDLDGSNLASVQNAFDGAGVRTMASLDALQLSKPDASTESVPEFAVSDAFHDEYEALTNSWLTLILTNPAAGVIPQHEELLRLAHLVHLTVHDPGLLGEADAIRRLRRALVVPPRVWTPAGRLNQQLLRRHQAALAGQGPAVARPGRAAAIVQAMAKHGELVARRETVESLLAKSQTAYLAWKQGKLAAAPRPAPDVGLKRARGLMASFFNRRPRVALRPRVGQPLLRLDAGFFTQLDQLLSPAEKTVYASLRLGHLSRRHTLSTMRVWLRIRGLVKRTSSATKSSCGRTPSRRSFLTVR